MKQIFFLFYFFLFILLLGCSSEENVNDGQDDKYCLSEDFKLKVEFTAPKSKNIVKTIALSGIITTNPEKVIQFNNLVDGIIISTHFSLGDYVKKGQILAKVKSPELSNWIAQKKSLKAQLLVAEDEYKKEKALFEDGISSINQLNRTKSEMEIIEANYVEISSNLELYNASIDDGVFLITAPKEGYITEKNISSGVHVTAFGESLFTIADIDEVWIDVNIYSSHLKDVYEGMPLEIRSLVYPDQVYTAKLNSISKVFDLSSHVIKGKVFLQNVDASLLPGMYVDLSAKSQTKEEAISIPTEALIFDDNQNYIILYHDDCNLEVRQVTVKGQNQKDTFIEEDLELSSTIVVKNQLLIYEQLKNFCHD